MKNLVLALGFTLASGLAVAAQETTGAAPPPPGPGGAHPAWQDAVGLTDEQREELQRVQAAGGTREEIRAILTPEQQEKILQLKRAHKGDGPAPEQLKDALGLSDEQVAQMQKIREEGGSRRAMAEVLTPEQRDKLRQLRPGSTGGHRLPPPKMGSASAGKEPPGWGLNPPQ